jgi:hypothetical protein
VECNHSPSQWLLRRSESIDYFKFIVLKDVMARSLVHSPTAVCFFQSSTVMCDIWQPSVFIFLSVSSLLCLSTFLPRFSFLLHGIFASVMRPEMVLRLYKLNLKKTRLRGLTRRANYTAERPPLVGEVSANACG